MTLRQSWNSTHPLPPGRSYLLQEYFMKGGGGGYEITEDSTWINYTLIDKRLYS